MKDMIAVEVIDGEARADSRALANRMSNKHRNVLALIEDYQDDLGAFGPLPFKTRVREAQQKSGGGLPERWALLNEEQCYFLLTLVRNSETTVPMKRELIQAFSHFRKQAETQRGALPTDPLELLTLSVQSLHQQRGQIRELEQNVQDIQSRLNTQPVRSNSEQRSRLHAAGKAFGKVHPRSWQGAWSAFKEAFGFNGAPLAAYDDLPQHRFDEAMNWMDLQTRTFSGQRGMFDQ